MDTLLQDVRYALRLCLSRPWPTAMIVLTLALGIGANVVVFSFVSGVLLKPFPFPDPDRIVALREATAHRDMSVSFPNYADWAVEARSFASMGAARTGEFSVSGRGGAERVPGARVSASLFPTLGAAPAIGRGFLPEEDQSGAADVVLLSHSLWVRLFASERDVLGRKVVLDGRPASVVGVMPPGFHYPVEAELWVPLAVDRGRAARGDRNLSVVARLGDGVELDQARAEMTAIAARLEPLFPANEGFRVVVLPLRDLYVRQGRAMLAVLSVAVGFVLAIACINVANLLVARGADRELELAVRASLGASRLRVTRQLVTESLALGLAAGAAGLVLAHWGISLLLRSIPVALPFWLKVGIDGRVLLYTTAVSVLTSLAFGFAPVRQSWKVDLNGVLKDHARGTPGGRRARRLRQALVAAEIALSVVLLSGAGLAISGFIDLQDVDPGFRPDSVLTAQLAPLPAARYPDEPDVGRFYEGLLARVRSLPGVVSAGANSQIPLQQRGGTETTVSLEGGDETRFNVNYQVVTNDYFKTLGIPLLRGRDFASSDTLTGPPVALVSERLARTYWPRGDSEGARISFSGPDGPWVTIVGVVGDVRHRRLGREPMMDVYAPHAQHPVRTMTLVVRSAGDPGALLATLRRECAAVDPEVPVHSLRTMDEVVTRSLWLQRFSIRMMTVFAVVALLLAVVGLFGVVSYAVAQRTHELAVRMALGAPSGHIVRLVLRQCWVVVAPGAAVGLALSVATAGALSAALENIRGVDPLVFPGVTVLIVLVALLACLLPVRRAVSLEAMAVLRRE
jgi:putative ABC transport system permease protein